MIVTAVWLSSAVVKTSFFSVGIVVFLGVGECRGCGDGDGVGLLGLPGGDRVAGLAAEEAVDQDGVEVPGLISEAGVDGERPACPRGEAPRGLVVDAEHGYVAFALGGAEVAADAPFDDPGGEPGVSRAAAVRRVLGTPSDPSGVRTPVL